MSDTALLDSADERELRVVQLQLQNEKLRLEIASLRRTRPWYHVIVEMIPLITAVLSIAGFLFGVFQFLSQQEKNRKTQEAQATHEKETAEREFMKPWLENQRGTYLEALTAALTAAHADDEAVRKKAINEFWRLYHGKMILVETKSVSGAMIQLGHCFEGPHPCNKSDLNGRCHALATAMAESMAATAKMTFEQFSANKFKYSSGR